MQNSNPRFLEILKVLTVHSVDVIVVGGVSAVLHGAPVTTFDLDIVHARIRNSVRSARWIRRFLGMIGKSRRWEDLRAHTRTMELEPGLVLRVLNLESWIAVREELGFPKDIAVLPVLRQALKQQSVN